MPGPLHAVISDIVMPRMSGFELVARLRQRHPRLAIVLVSGYAERYSSDARPLPPEAQRLAKRINAVAGNAWVYHFTRVREDAVARGELGAYHGAEYPYIFGTHDSYMTTTDTDLALEEIMQSYWVNFASTGDPNTDETPRWPLFAGDSPMVQELGDSVARKPAPEPELCALFEAWHAENHSATN